MPTPLVISGVARSGMGKVAGLPEEVLRERQAITGLVLVPGTFNVAVAHLSDTILRLGLWHFELPGPPNLGPLRFWPVGVSAGAARDAPGFVVRHAHSHAPYLEIVSDVHFRSCGARDGDLVKLACRSH